MKRKCIDQNLIYQAEIISKTSSTQARFFQQHPKKTKIDIAYDVRYRNHL